MTLLSKSINTFKETVKNVSHNQEILNLRINQLIDVINNVQLQETNLFEFFRIHMVLTQISSFYQNIYDILEKIEVAITFAKINTFHNAIVNKDDLLSELKFINNKLSLEKLPFEPNLENILNIENSLEISSYVKNNEIVFIIEIPLVERTSYKLFHLFPLPTRAEKFYKMIIPNFEYLLINEKNFGYSNQPCKRITFNEFLCNHIHSENFYKTTPCEVQLLRYESNISNCNPLYVDIEDIQLQNIDDDKWILITNKDIIATETCGNSQSTILFNGTYLIELSFPCSIKIGDIIVKSYKNTKQTFQNVPLPNLNYNLTYKSLYKKVKLLNLNNVNLNKLDKLQEEINIQKRENSKLLNESLYYDKTSFWTVLLYLIVSLLILFLLWKYLWPIISAKTKRNIQKEDIVI